MINENLSFYKFIHKQILVIIALNVATAPGYLLMGFLYTSMIYEFIWLMATFLIAAYGYVLYKKFDVEMTIKTKDEWLNKVRVFMFSYSVSWIFMFAYYVSFDNLEMHYITIATQIGSSVVAATLLASQKKLMSFTVVFLMLPLVAYFLYIGETFSFILAFFSAVLAAVIIYAAKNTNDYIVKSSYQAYHDHLTQLGNRRYFLEILESSVREHKDKFAYLLLIDLDYFKTINDTLGHDVGDELLREVAKRMNEVSSDCGNNVARLGGDEFCVLSPAFETQEDCEYNAKTFAEKLLQSIKNNYLIDGNHLYISASVGISVINNSNVKAAEFLKEADMAMYETKNNGRDNVTMFDSKISKLVQEKLEIEKALHFAIEKGEITLNYQPQVDVNRKTVGCEVLVRWTSAELGFIGPDVFIPIAENTGYIIELGEYILEESFKTIQDWKSKDMSIEQISINISMRQLLSQSFIKTVDTLHNKYIGKDTSVNIIFEITETSSADDLDYLVRMIHKLKKYNISFSMDDFGTGYSSLSYLREIPLSELKIDKSFIDMLADTQQASLVKTIIDIAKNLNLVIVAEGVEEEYQKEFLADLDCDLFQGYLFSRPLTKEKFEEYCCS